jgi:hypothetical protein
MAKELEKNKKKEEKKSKITVRVNQERRRKKEIKKTAPSEELSQFEESRASKEPLPNQKDRIERDKKLMMWAGVSFFMILILGFWVLNIKSVFKGATEARENPQKFEWGKITNEFDQTIEQIKEGLNELKQASVTDNISTTTEDNLNASNFLPVSEDIGSSSPEEGGDLEELKVRLKELEGEIESKN